MEQSEIAEYWVLVHRHGAPNCWTGTTGKLAAALGRTLKRLEQLETEFSDGQKRTEARADSCEDLQR